MFLKIGEIDTLKEQYEADVLIQSKWREPALDKDKVQNNQIIEWADYWNPKLFIENTIGDPRENAFQVVISYYHTLTQICESSRRNPSNRFAQTSTCSLGMVLTLLSPAN